jgi:hypothetical protein
MLDNALNILKIVLNAASFNKHTLAVRYQVVQVWC